MKSNGSCVTLSRTTSRMTRCMPATIANSWQCASRRPPTAGPDNQPDDAWKSWRRSLELSEEFLTNILEYASFLTAEELTSKILPDQPEVLLAAALHLYPRPEDASKQRVPLAKAVELLTNQRQPLSAANWSTKARLHTLLKQPEEAVAAYEAALAKQPEQYAWRFEMAKLLFDQGRIQDARRELTMILGQQPNYAEAKKLLDEVGHAIAAGKDRAKRP